MPRAATWSEERSLVNDTRPKRWLCGGPEPRISDWEVFGGSMSQPLDDRVLVSRIYWEGWPLIPCSGEGCGRCQAAAPNE
jgi:hypothetical protein